MSILAEPTRLRPFVLDIFRAAGSSDWEAAEIADHLIDANLAGHDSHGVGMMPAYMHHLKEGWVKPNQSPVRVGGQDPFAVFDAQMGYGQPTVTRVMASRRGDRAPGMAWRSPRCATRSTSAASAPTPSSCWPGA